MDLSSIRKLSAEAPEPCWRCEDRGWYWTTPVGFNPFSAGALGTARAMYRQSCACLPALNALLAEDGAA